MQTRLRFLPRSKGLGCMGRGVFLRHGFTLDPSSKSVIPNQGVCFTTVGKTMRHKCSGLRKPTTMQGAIIQFAKLVKGQAFSPEEVINWAAEFGMVLDEPRHWGAHFKNAERMGFIKPSIEQFRRKSSNGSMRSGWILS